MKSLNTMQVKWKSNCCSEKQLADHIIITGSSSIILGITFRPQDIWRQQHRKKISDFYLAQQHHWLVEKKTVGNFPKIFNDLITFCQATLYQKKLRVAKIEIHECCCFCHYYRASLLKLNFGFLQVVTMLVPFWAACNTSTQNYITLIMSKLPPKCWNTSIE